MATGMLLDGVQEAVWRQKRRSPPFTIEKGRFAAPAFGAKSERLARLFTFADFRRRPLLPSSPFVRFLPFRLVVAEGVVD